MLDACLPIAAGADMVVGVAAVADFRAERAAGKIRSGEPRDVRLLPNPDVIGALAKASQGLVVAFAAEPDAGLEAARAKIEKKGAFAIAVNDVSRDDIAFDSDANELTLLFHDGRTVASGRRSKLECALWLFREVCAGRS
jgi:phosphopantothenoylcysteine decarboxylase/phosphopantothenate--cysteine ligase